MNTTGSRATSNYKERARSRRKRSRNGSSTTLRMVIIRSMTPLGRRRHGRRRRGVAQVLLRRSTCHLARWWRRVPVFVRRIIVIHEPVVPFGQHDHARRRIVAQTVVTIAMCIRRRAAVGICPRICCGRVGDEGMCLVWRSCFIVLTIFNTP